MDDSYSFGAWVRRRRKACDLTQADLARQIGVAAITIQKIEADERRPSRQVAELLADQLHVPTSERESFLAVARGEQAVDRLTHPRQDMADTQERRVHLPNQLSSFIGRQRELAELPLLLQRADARLMTLTGPGGSGKTRLALQVAAGMKPSYPDGIWFIDLAPVSTPDQVVTTIAHTLGLPESSDRPIRAKVLNWLHQRQTLLILDNCEQVIEAAADLVGELLRRTSSVTVLATSRMPLRVTAEHEYAVAPLALPTSGTLPSLDQLSQYDAVALFIARARAVRADFAITTINAPAIIEICARLDGLPLAIELAAARIRLFPPDQLLSRLMSARMQTLTGGARDLPTRQQTIRATIDWSYRLLSPAQQCLLAYLSVFVGGWTLAAAEAVCGDATTDVVDGLDALVTHSLVHIPATVDGSRYTLLETIREFALERLLERGETEQLAQLHAAYFTRLAEEAEPKLQSAEQLEWLSHLDQEQGNMQIAFVWDLQSPDANSARQTLGLRAAVALWYYWFLRGRFVEACTWLIGPWVRDPQIAVTLRIAALSWAAVLQSRPVGRLSDDAARYVAEAAALTQFVAEPTLQVLPAIAQATNYMGFPEFAPPTEAAIAMLRQEDAPWLHVFATIHLAKLFAGHGHEHRRAIRLCTTALTTAGDLGDPWLIAEAQTILGYYHALEGAYDVAQRFETEALAGFRAIGAHHSAAAALLHLATIAADATGDITKARQLHTERLAFEQTIGNLSGVVVVLNSLCDFATIQGDYQTALQYAQMAPLTGHRESVDLLFATAAFGRGNLTEALARIEAYERSAPEASEDPDLRTRRACIALAQGDLTTAQTILHAVLAQVPDNVDLWLLDCQVRIYQNDLQAAQQALEQGQLRIQNRYLTIISLAMTRAYAQLLQAQIHLATGHIVDAAIQLRACLAIYHRAGARPAIATTLDSCAKLMLLNSAPTHACHLWAAAEALREHLGAPMWPVDKPEYERRVTEAKAQANPEEWDAVWAAGRTLTWEQAADEALAWLAEVRAV